MNPFGDRILSTLGNPTFLADYLAMHLPLGLVLASAARTGRGFASWTLACVAMAAAIVLSGSKGGQLAALAAGAGWLLITLRHRTIAPRRFAVPPGCRRGLPGAGPIPFLLLPQVLPLALDFERTEVFVHPEAGNIQGKFRAPGPKPPAGRRPGFLPRPLPRIPARISLPQPRRWTERQPRAQRLAGNSLRNGDRRVRPLPAGCRLFAPVCIPKPPQHGACPERPGRRGLHGR